MTKTVATPSADHDKAVQRAKLPRTLMGNTAAMRRAGEEYLPKEASETAIAYNNRLKRATLFNAFRKTVSDLVGRVFSKPPQLGADVPTDMVAFAENVDLTGRHFDVFARDGFFDSLQTGIGYILVDAHRAVSRTDGLPPTLADYKRAGWRPYLIYIPLERLIGWKSQEIGGVETLTQVRIKESVTVADGDYDEKEVEQIRVLSPGRWETWRKSETKGEEWVLYEEGTTSLTRIPLAPIYINRTGFMTGEPPLQDLADQNVAHWQSQSDQRNILHVARVPILFGTGIAEDSVLEIGASSMVRNSNPAATLQYVEHSGSAIGAGNVDLKNIEYQMQVAGLQLLIPNPGQTATGEIRDDAKELSSLAQMAAALKDALEQAFGFMAEFQGLGLDAGGSILVNNDFGVTGRMGDVQYLTQAVLAGKLDDQTYLEELKRRGALGDSVDVDVVLHRIDTASPQLDGPPMDLHAGHSH
ncbi:DUF4055 domain-containing protein [Tardiphaga sp. vice278]|uniref:DUF4055 domain-containing protein n=1 Tax=Tardiphaga sp. vice278 TaxID=2592815 RepID=UPI001161D82E|nr:DUF4055 domain-containing protein [Tardiphaga sp. vice278]QDM16840.1 DUF4055 domain-containing protein [Tardiphaga sp. vice278]